MGKERRRKERRKGEKEGRKREGRETKELWQYVHQNVKSGSLWLKRLQVITFFFTDLSVFLRSSKR